MSFAFIALARKMIIFNELMVKLFELDRNLPFLLFVMPDQTQ